MLECKKGRKERFSWLNLEKEVKEMDLSTQTPVFVAPVDGEGEGNRDKIIKFRVNPREDYLLSEVDKNLGFGNVSTSIRWLVEHYSDIKKAEALIKLFKSWKEAEKSIDALV